MTCLTCTGPVESRDGFYCDFCWWLKQFHEMHVKTHNLVVDLIPAFDQRMAELKALKLSPLEKLWHFGAGMQPGDEEKFWIAIRRTGLLHLLPKGSPRTPPPA